MDIKNWLEELGLEQYGDAFITNDIDKVVLLDLNGDDLKELGITSLGHRKKILAAIAALKQRSDSQDTHPSSPVELSSIPSILALPLEEYLEEPDPVLKLWHACDVVELTLRMMVTIGLADLRREGELPKEILGEIRSRIEEPTLGKWQGLAMAVAKIIPKKDSVVPELAGLVNDVFVPLLDGPRGQRIPETSFSALRNQLAHGGGVTKGVAKRLLAVWQPKFKESISKMSWLGELTLVISEGKGEIGALRGPSKKMRPYVPGSEDVSTALQKLFEHGDEVALVRENTVLPLWPLTLYGLPKIPDPDAQPSRAAAPQIYVRRGEVRLHFTPVGSDEVCQSEADETALDAFLKLFRWNEKEEQQKTMAYEVRGFEMDINKDASRLIGRVNELDVIRKALTSANEGVLWLTGAAGIGKSYMVARIAAEFTEVPPKNTLVLSYRFKAGDDRCTRDQFIRFAIERLKTLDDLASVEETDEQKLKKRKQENPVDELKEFLELLGDNRVLFILDGMDEIAERDSIFAEDIPLGLSYSGVTWLCAGRPERGLPEAFSPERSRHLFPEGVPPLNTEDIRTMLLEKIGPLREKTN